MENERLITIAIHTLERAQQLRALLEREGVGVTLQNVDLAEPTMAAGIRVRIAAGDLPLALRIIENPEIFSVEAVGAEVVDHVVLVPVDFTAKTLNAVRVAFRVAATMRAKVVLLHSFLVPHTNPLTSLGHSVTFNGSDLEAGIASTSVAIASSARAEMRKLEQALRAEIKRAELPAVKFSAVLREGVPEESIGAYIKENPQVRLLVMGTRAAEKKAEDKAGSITAEVLDSVRIQALTVPESGREFRSFDSVKNIVLLSHLEQADFLALDALHRLLPDGAEDVAIKVLCMPNDKYSAETNSEAKQTLNDYCGEHFPNYSFTLSEHDKNNSELETGVADLVVVPNRKKNIFMRLFNPGAAHRILFHTDIPLLVIPV